MTISYASSVTTTLFYLAGVGFSVSSFVFMIGGGVLIIRSVLDMHDMYSASSNSQLSSRTGRGYWELLKKLILINVVFSLDSVFIGLSFTDNILLISVAVISSVILLSIIAAQVAMFLDKYLSVRIAALCFMMFLGAYLFMTGVGFPISKKYLYAAAVFTVVVEILAILFSKNLIKDSEIK